MANEMPNLWPENIVPDASELRPPVLILREQAELLASKTKGIVVGNVRSWAHKNRFYHRLMLVAPVLDNYEHELLTIRHDIGLYPVQVIPDGELPDMDAGDEEEFLEALRRVFNSERSMRVLRAMVAQSLTETKLPVDEEDDLPF